MTLQGGYFKEAVFYDKIERMTLWGPRNLHSSKRNLHSSKRNLHSSKRNLHSSKDYHNQEVSNFDQKNKSKVTKI